MRMHGIVLARASPVQIAFVRTVAIYGGQLLWDAKVISRGEDLQLLLNRQASSTLGALPIKPVVPIMRDS
jgi:hypothetical protein